MLMVGISLSLAVVPCKALVKDTLEQRSVSACLHVIRASYSDRLHLLSQHSPSSVGARLLDSGALDLLAAADDWERFRLGLVPLSVGTGQVKSCPLCGLVQYGNAHLLASCGSLALERQVFLSQVDYEWRIALQMAPPQDWSTSMLSAHLELSRLGATVKYVSLIVGKLNKTQLCLTLCFPSSPLGFPVVPLGWQHSAAVWSEPGRLDLPSGPPVPHCGRASGCGCFVFLLSFVPCFLVSWCVVFVGASGWVGALGQPTAFEQLHRDSPGKAPHPGVAVKRRARR